jgi:hypothetical protein
MVELYMLLEIIIFIRNNINWLFLVRNLHRVGFGNVSWRLKTILFINFSIDWLSPALTKTFQS